LNSFKIKIECWDKLEAWKYIKIKNHDCSSNFLYDFFTGSGGLLDNANWKDAGSE